MLFTQRTPLFAVLAPEISVADAALFQAVFTGQRGGSGAVPANPYLFTGRRLDFDLRDTDGSVTGQPGRPLLVLYDYRARTYDPFHGRFGQRDPALYAESMNLYEFVRSNPQGRLDPSGQFSLGDLMGAVTTGARIYGWYATGQSIRQAVSDFAAGVSLRNIMLDMAIGFAVDRAGGKMLDALVDVAGPLMKRQALKFGQGWRAAAGKGGSLRQRMLDIDPPPGRFKNPQAHHDLPQKHRSKFEELGLDIDDPAFGRWVEGGPEGLHQSWSYEFSKAWDEFFAAFEAAGTKPTVEDVLKKLMELQMDPRFQ